jgi:dTDP-4-dehydrorhamnose reductase
MARKWSGVSRGKIRPWSINAAAYNQVDIAEKEPAPAMLANGLAVRNLAMCCRQHDARLVHFSTDYVFDGTAGRAYTEEDATHPLGRTRCPSWPASFTRRRTWIIR